MFGKVNESLVYAVVLELSLALSAILLGFFIGVNPREHLVPWWDYLAIARSLGIGTLVGMGLALGMQVLSKLPIRSIQKLDRAVESQLRTVLGPMTIPELLVLSLSAGIGEEILFRGLIQGWWMSLVDQPTFWNVLPGMLASAICFGFAHPLSKTYIALAALAGLLFSVLFWATGDLLACVLAHASYDAIICVYWKWSERKRRLN